jgi:hypothetical protein
MCMHFEGGEWTLQECQIRSARHGLAGFFFGCVCASHLAAQLLSDAVVMQRRCYPGPLTSVLATSHTAVVTVQDCLISRCESVAIGALGYGLFAWGTSSFTARDSDFTELKVPPPSSALNPHLPWP